MATNFEPVIAIMGPTGSGKSTIIDILTGHTRFSGSSLKSVTSQVKAVKVHVPYGQGTTQVTLVDTPGFDDTNNSDLQTLDMISKWMEKEYRGGRHLTGILYLHRITDNRMAGTPHRNLRMFGKLCGGEQAVGPKVTFVTTMWDKVQPDTGEQREAKLCEYWKPMVNIGANIDRLDKSRQKAETVIRAVLSRNVRDQAVLLQKELVDMGRELNETEAAQTLYSQFQLLLAQHKQTIVELEKAAQRVNDPVSLQDLQAERARIEDELRKTFDQAQELKLSFAKRLVNFFRKSFGMTKGVELGDKTTS